jgi:hypothetical protein
MMISYVDDIMDEAFTMGVDDDLRQLAQDDTLLLGQLGVSDERERNLAFYLDHFLDDLCDETSLSVPKNRTDVLAKAFEELRGAKDIDLADIRSALYRAMGGKRIKVAYPNTTGVMEMNAKPQRDVDKWVKTLGEIYAAGRIGADRHYVLRNLTEEWDPVEKLDFQQWLRYYERGDHEKYAAIIPQQSEQVIMPPLADQHAVRPKPETRPIEENRKALISRLDSAKRLLRFLAPPVWPQERWNSIYRALSDLEQEITSLRTATSIRDRIIRTANIWDRAGFGDGAETLRKIAQPPMDEDVASQIEKALTGHEYDNKPPSGDFSTEPNIAPPPMEGGAGMPSPMPETAPNAPVEGMPPEAMEALPEPPPPPEPTPEVPEAPKKPAKDENPYAGASTMDILEVLEPLMKRFKEREIVRQLSKVDMMMDGLNIVSYFPELGEAVGRLIETDSYVGARLERIIGKLRGGMRDESDKKEEKKPTPPSVEMGPSPTEETATIVSEKPTKTPAEVPSEEIAVAVGEHPPISEETAVTVGERPSTSAPAPTAAGV